MSDLIDRQTALDAIENSECGYTWEVEQAYKAVAELPSAELERKTGEWTLYESRSDIYDLEGVCTWGKAYRCSECGFIHWVIEDFGIYSFCPNCGADMRGEDGKA